MKIKFAGFFRPDHDPPLVQTHACFSLIVTKLY